MPDNAPVTNLPPPFTPNAGMSQPVAPQYMAPQQMMPQYTAPQQMMPQYTAPQQGTQGGGPTFHSPWDPTVIDARQIPIAQLTREDMVIRTYFNDAVLGPKLRRYMDPKLFLDPINQGLIKVIQMFERKFNRIPSAQELILGMNANGFSEQVIAKLSYICNTPVVGVRQEYLIALIEKHFQERMSENLLISASENIHDQRVSGINELIPKLKEAVNFSLHTNLGLNVYNDIETALALLQERKECIPSAINEIRVKTGMVGKDGALRGGGYYRKTLTLFAGQPNVGKSLILGNEAVFAYLMGYNVFYISLELSEDYIWQRLIANICDVPITDVLDMSAEACRARFDQVRAEHNHTDAGNIQIKRLKTTTTPADIEAYVDQYEAQYGKLDLLVIDYIGIMKPGLSAAEQRSMYLDGVAKAEQIRDFLIERNIAGLSAVQFNRTGYNTVDAGIESISGSSGYSETCDVMISITSDSVLRECGMFYHLFLKNRFGRNSDHFVTRCDYTKMKWFDANQEEMTKYQELCTERDAVLAAQNPPRRGGGGGRQWKQQAAPPQQPPPEQLQSRPGERVSNMV
jgi:hypothetical protein